MTILTNLLRIDALARTHGCGLNPKLRDALAADLRWPSKAASPVPAQPIGAADLPENAVPLPVGPKKPQEKRA